MWIIRGPMKPIARFHRFCAMNRLHILRGRVLSTSLLLLACTCFAAQPEGRHTTFTFNQFNGSNLIMTNDSSIVSNAIALTNQSLQMLGRAFYPTPLQVRGHESFSTTFVFSIVPLSANLAGQGLAFVMTPRTSAVGVAGDQYLGLLNVSGNGQPYNHLFAVEFDTARNLEFHDINDNHVGVDINSLISRDPKAAGYWIGAEFQPLSLKSGRNIQAWIDYDHPRNRLNVSISLAGNAEPAQPLISLRINLSDVFEDQMYVGFSASTGGYQEAHYILAWSFSTQGAAPSLDVSGLPSFMPKKSIYRSTGFKAGAAVASLLLFCLLIAALFRLWRRREYGEFIEEWELEYWPHRFPYKQLSMATKGFAEEQLLGAGGFGRVYQGVIPGSGLQVAVKCIRKEITEGMKEFIAEISSMGRLQHRNLVRLRGWCRKNQQLFIVYDYMANGSLDRMIFGNPKTVLRWPQRFAILKGVANGLLYLHQQWEKRVVHRDIKSSNVLLDSELNARLGDFGLARLYDHAQNPQTTHVVGTLGYIAPELIQIGKATPSSDTFSFGVVLLEVACGRRPVEPSKGAEEVVLVDWVWDLYASQRLIEAADPKLGGEFDVQEMERVLQLGLFCSYPEPEGRPGTRQALQILEGQAPLPPLRMPSFDTSIVWSDTPASSFERITDGISDSDQYHTFSTTRSAQRLGQLVM